MDTGRPKTLSDRLGVLGRLACLVLFPFKAILFLLMFLALPLWWVAVGGSYFDCFEDWATRIFVWPAKD